MPAGATSRCPTPGRGYRGALEPCGLARAFGHVLGKESHTLVTMSDTWTWLPGRCLLRLVHLEPELREPQRQQRFAAPHPGGGVSDRRDAVAHRLDGEG